MENEPAFSIQNSGDKFHSLQNQNYASHWLDVKVLRLHQFRHL